MLLQKEYVEMRNKCFAKTIIHPLTMGNEFFGHPLAIKKARNKDFQYLSEIALQQDWKPNFDLKKVLQPLTAVIVTDTTQTIEWVSSYFTKMTGYLSEDTLGNKPRFLQGEQTSEEDRLKIRKNLSALKRFKGQLINYRKDGEPYLCKVEILPVFNTSGKHVNFIAFETDKV